MLVQSGSAEGRTAGMSTKDSTYDVANNATAQSQLAKAYRNYQAIEIAISVI
jgi:hypothetical protein